MRYDKFEDLPVWKLSLEITRILYDFTAKPGWNKDFALRDQTRRAVISISSNIVEGFEKNNNNEFIRFLKIAKGSVGELRSQIHIGYLIDYINKEEFEMMNTKLERLAKEIGGLTGYLEKYRAMMKNKIRNS